MGRRRPACYPRRRQPDVVEGKLGANPTRSRHCDAVSRFRLEDGPPIPSPPLQHVGLWEGVEAARIPAKSGNLPSGKSSACRRMSRHGVGAWKRRGGRMIRVHALPTAGMLLVLLSTPALAASLVGSVTSGPGSPDRQRQRRPGRAPRALSRRPVPPPPARSCWTRPRASTSSGSSPTASTRHRSGSPCATRPRPPPRSRWASPPSPSRSSCRPASSPSRDRPVAPR